MDAITVVEDEVRELVRRRGLDPVVDGAVIRRLVDDVVADYQERTLTSALPPLLDPAGATRRVCDAVAGFGPLQAYLDDPTIEEIWVNEPGRVFVARRGHSELTTTILSAGEVRDLVEKMLKSSGRRVDLSTPFVIDSEVLPDCAPSPRAWTPQGVPYGRGSAVSAAATRSSRCRWRRRCAAPPMSARRPHT